MKKLAVAAAMVLSLGGVHAAFALSPFPTKALNFSSWMVRAYDQCSPSGMSVIPGGAACLAANGTTDDSATVQGATMRFARLIVRKFTLASKGRVRVTGRGFKAGQRIQAQLTLRVTQDNKQTKHPPLAGQTVTFVDTTIACGVGPGNCWVARPNGALAASQDLKDCLTQSGASNALAARNIQIVDAALLNCDTGKIFAVPGILQQ